MFRMFKREPGFYKNLLALAIPMVIQNLITNSLGLVDTFMVGTLGEEPLAGVTLANIPVFVVQLMMFGIQSGSAVLISQYWGKKDKDAVNRVLGIGLYAAGTIALAFALVMSLAPHWFMGLFGSDETVIAAAIPYARIVGWSYVFDSFVQVYIGAHRSMGNPNRGLYILGVSMVSNTVLNWVFIFGKLGAPALGAEGAALGTLIARVLAFLIAVIWAIRDKDFRVRPALVLRPGGEMVRRFIRYGTPVLFNETLWGLGTSLFPTIMGHMDGSKEILAAYAIAGSITNLCVVGAFAIAGSTAILVGQTIGAGRADEAHGLGVLLNTLAFLLGLVIAALCLGVLFLFIKPVLYPRFHLSAEAKDICDLILTVGFCILPLRFFDTTVIVGVLRGGGDVRMAAIIDVAPLWLAALPLAALAGLVLKAGIFWVEMAMVSESLIKCCMGVVRLRSGKWVRDVTVAIQD